MGGTWASAHGLMPLGIPFPGLKWCCNVSRNVVQSANAKMHVFLSTQTDALHTQMASSHHLDHFDPPFDDVDMLNIFLPTMGLPETKHASIGR